MICASPLPGSWDRVPLLIRAADPSYNPVIWDPVEVAALVLDSREVDFAARFPSQNSQRPEPAVEHGFPLTRDVTTVPP